MFTLHHGFWIYFFSRRHYLVWYYVFGSMLPDYVYAVLAALLLLDGRLSVPELAAMSPKVMMSYLPMVHWAVVADLLGHSVVVWGGFFILAYLSGLKRCKAVAVGWGTHLLLDELTHGAHANYYLYPLSMAAVHSPVSYWEPRYFAEEFKIVNSVLMSLAAFYLLYHWWLHRKQKLK